MVGFEVRTDVGHVFKLTDRSRAQLAADIRAAAARRIGAEVAEKTCDDELKGRRAYIEHIRRLTGPAWAPILRYATEVWEASNSVEPDGVGLASSSVSWSAVPPFARAALVPRFRAQGLSCARSTNLASRLTV